MPNSVENYSTVLMALWFLVLGYSLGWVIYG